MHDCRESQKRGRTGNSMCAREGWTFTGKLGGDVKRSYRGRVISDSLKAALQGNVENWTIGELDDEKRAKGGGVSERDDIYLGSEQSWRGTLGKRKYCER